MLVKFCGGEEDCNVPLLKESIEVLSRAAESRELRTSGHGDLVARYTEIIARALQFASGGNRRSGLCRAYSRRGKNFCAGTHPE